ncbi:monocarboxylate uptake permease MctP [Alicyclobacillus tolerans]|uniref:Solute:Na+ symporter, SSS family n=1 Tax=Alicyclobacillus tolerans TaxID=90970 RepID=A0A1M6W6K8_9BACL|nr:sodium:solute symporter [Alicyclobacillus montanus]SHK89269.1 solute:Na+ symporter, SSS family [Alicyclobacillus montanus]
MHAAAVIVFVLLFIFITVLGFVASRWRKGNLSHLDEWGLGGRRFGTFVTWFLLGGDLYTAYTFIAVPALMYGSGALGFYAVPYTIVVYPLAFLFMPRLWSVAKKHGYVTASDFVQGRYQSRLLALAIAVTGILATLPYIALQLVGMKAVLAAMGLAGDWPLIIAFIILALYTYTSGLRAPAMIAFVKDILIYVVILVAAIVIPMKLGGFSHIFHAAAAALATHKPKGAVVISPKLFLPYATLAFGSAVALFLYPHAVTGTLSASSRVAVKRNMAFLPIYSFMLGVLALLGYMALAAGIHTKVTSNAVPLLFLKEFPSWFAGVGFAAIAIGALVPAAIMSIAASNLFTRNIYKEFFVRQATPEHEARVAKIFSLLVKLGALYFVIGIPTQYAINLQLLGGIWILQTVPAIVLGLYTRWFNRYALFIGWAVGMIYGTGMAVENQFKSSIYTVHLGHLAIASYAGLTAGIVNLILSVVLTLILKAVGVKSGTDMTDPTDYELELTTLQN